MDSSLYFPLVFKGSQTYNFPPTSHLDNWNLIQHCFHPPRIQFSFHDSFFPFSTWNEHEYESVDSKVKRQRNINGWKCVSFQAIFSPNLVRCHSAEISQHSHTTKYDNRSKHNWKISKVELEAFLSEFIATILYL